ncbi:MAG: PAS domain S-box protein [Planctomycetes bacterium]|nr:PAS domain S-box protein [Planctomycetota bacterium]
MKSLIQVVAVVVAYLFAGTIGLAFAVPPGHASAVWPASGIAVTALFLFGHRFWPGVWIAAFVVNAATDATWGLAAAFATGNTIEAVLAAWLLHRLLPQVPFRRAADGFVFISVAVTSSLPAATIGAVSMLLAARIDRDGLINNWSTWMLGDLAGQVIVVPLLLSLAGRRWSRLDVSRLLEMMLLFALQTILSFLVFGGLLPERISREVLYLPMVLLIWCALRFELVEVTAGTFVFSAAAVWGTWAGFGAYGSTAALGSLFDLQLLLITYAMTALVVASIVAGRQEAQSLSRRSEAELQRTTAERNRAEAWFRQILTASPDALIVCNEEGQILLVNEAAVQLFGYSRDELIGGPIEILVPLQHREKHRENRDRYKQSPYVRLMGSGVELTAARKDGTEFCAEIALGPINTEDGLIVFCAVRDISSRKRAEQALRDSEQRFTLAVQGSDAGIWDWDLRTNQVYFSARWKSILGYGEDELRDEFDEWKSRLHPEDRERALATVNAYLEGQSSDFELEHRLRHKDGSYRCILARGAAVRDDSGKPYRMVGSHLDITDRKAMEEDLRDQLGRLIAAEEIQSYLLPKGPPDIPGFDIAGKCYPAEFAAGDHFDFLFRKDGAFVPMIGDVSGHGVGPAILMASLQAHLRSLIEVHDDLCELVSRANIIIGGESPHQLFVTLLVAIIDTRARTLSYVRCGHPPGFIMNAAGEVTTEMTLGGVPLGIKPDAQFCQSPPIPFQAGDIIVMLTDGILESISAEGAYFGLENTVRTIREHRGEPAARIIETLREAVRDFTGKDALTDDITLVVMKVLE